MVDVENGRQKAERLLESGKAERKLRKIIEAQGGNPKVKPQDIEIGDKTAELTTDRGGRVLWINNEDTARIAREAGAPKEKGAGVVLKAKLGENVKKGGVLLEIYAERNAKLETALKLAEKLHPIGLTERPEERMLMDRIPSRVIERKTFMLER
jgi:AMP phosphorylase